MKDKLKNQVLSLFDEGNSPLSLKDICRLTDRERVKLSGYLEAMADYEDLVIKQAGPANVYSLKNPKKRKKRYKDYLESTSEKKEKGHVDDRR